VDARLGELEAAIETIDDRPFAFNPDEMGRAGAFVSIDRNGQPLVERGFVRPEDEQPVAPEQESEPADEAQASAVPLAAGEPAPALVESEEDEGMRPLPDRLVSELTAYRTVALRHALSLRPDVASLAVLHALTLRVFYPYAGDSCLELDLRVVSFPAQSPGLTDSAPARALAAAHETWRTLLPSDPDALWATLTGWDEESRAALLAFAVAQAVNAVVEPYNRRPRAIAHADLVAEAVGLDVASTGWTPTADTFLGRVTKARILVAVAEASGQDAADRIEHLKKGDMVARAEELLQGSFWLPEPLRGAGYRLPADHTPEQEEPRELHTPDLVEQSAAPACATAMAESAPVDDPDCTAEAPLTAA
jgi:ParB family chromosome partitioning protein